LKIHQFYKSFPTDKFTLFLSKDYANDSTIWSAAKQLFSYLEFEKGKRRRVIMNRGLIAGKIFYSDAKAAKGSYVFVSGIYGGNALLGILKIAV